MSKISLARYQIWNWIFRFILAGVFIYAGVLKINSPLEFADSIVSYQILPVPLINLMALGLPFFEIACGLLVLFGCYTRIGILGMIGMLVLFMGGILAAIIWKLPIDCGCFGKYSWLESNLWIALVRDGILLFLSVFVYRSPTPKS